MYNKTSKYILELDGLRAIAVLAVVIFHMSKSLLPGGYLGVDIFFVISGFIITRTILMSEGIEHFNYIKFLLRRIRRLVPLLLVVVSISWFFALWLMLPSEIENYGQSVVATQFFANNILLFLTSGYWDLAAQFKPLLHTWSLAVEEQFYLIFPLLILMSRNRSHNFFLNILTISFLISLLITIFAASENEKASFYMLHTRWWEFAIGCILAVIKNEETNLKNNSSNIAYVSFYFKEKIFVSSYSSTYQYLALIFLLLSFLMFDESLSVPGLHTLIPVLSSIILIGYFGTASIVNNILRSTFVRYIGVRSYGFYLWHWPALVFLSSFSKDSPNYFVTLLVVLISFILSIVSYRLIEVPFRYKLLKKPKYLYFIMIWSLLLAGLGLYSHYNKGILFGFKKEFVSSDKSIAYNRNIFKYEKDYFETSKKTKILIVGNSFARDFANVVLEGFDSKNYELIYYASDDSCEVKVEKFENLFDTAKLIFITGDQDYSCIERDRAKLKDRGYIYYIGDKHFGDNLNWLSRIKVENRKNLSNYIRPEYQPSKKTLSSDPSSFSGYISFYKILMIKNDRVAITNLNGELLSHDRLHLTSAGALYVVDKIYEYDIFEPSVLEILNNNMAADIEK